MDNELAVLAASGATTLVSLMATDSWTLARRLVERFFASTDSDSTAIADLENARNRLVGSDAADLAETTRDVTDQWHAHLRQLVVAGSVTVDNLRGLLNSLQRLADTSTTRQSTVHNEVNGGIQHGPVIQAGRITGLTFHVQTHGLQGGPGPAG